MCSRSEIRTLRNPSEKGQSLDRLGAFPLSRIKSASITHPLDYSNMVKFLHVSKNGQVDGGFFSYISNIPEDNCNEMKAQHPT